MLTCISYHVFISRVHTHPLCVVNIRLIYSKGRIVVMIMIMMMITSYKYNNITDLINHIINF